MQQAIGLGCRVGLQMASTNIEEALARYDGVWFVHALGTLKCCGSYHPASSYGEVSLSFERHASHAHAS